MNDMEAYGDGYMEPEEEWEREGLLDPAWEKQQKKVKLSSFFFRLIIFYIFSFILVKNFDSIIIYCAKIIYIYFVG